MGVGANGYGQGMGALGGTRLVPRMNTSSQPFVVGCEILESVRGVQRVGVGSSCRRGRASS